MIVQSLPSFFHRSYFFLMRKGIEIVVFQLMTLITFLRAAAAAAAAKSLQSCPTLCDPIDSSPPGSPIPGVLQERTLEWVAISFSNAWKWKMKGKSLRELQRNSWSEVTGPAFWGCSLLASGPGSLESCHNPWRFLLCFLLQHFENLSSTLLDLACCHSRASLAV